ncbi:MAG: hypothetical protein K2J73_01075 [Oscillospiraceae bacterium]|nr:hypothetical protein [Oscillospiraceae bacterium]
MRIKFRAAAFMLAASASVLLFASCSTRDGNISQITDIAEAVPAETSEQLVRNAPSAYALANNFDGGIVDEPFSSYTYDFSVYGSNYLITVTPDENGTGLALTVEDNQFGFSKFSVTPPDNYMVNLPYSQQYASQVCTVIKSSSEENSDIPDLLKIDFFLMNFDDESLPYSVSRLYSILDSRLVEVEVYNTETAADGAAELSGEESTVSVTTRSVEVKNDSDILDRMNYIPESDLYRTESLKFMPEPIVTVNEDGSLFTEIITYTLNPNDMTMRRARETWTEVNDNPLYYGYAAHSIAGNIYQYFISTSLNVSDYENYVEVAAADSSDSRYFFKVDDPRFSTLTELRNYTLKYFDEKIVNEMFLKAPQQYRDIGGELYTILGDGGINEELGKLTITSCEVSGNTVTYHTKQEKFNSDHMLDGYVDGGDFVIEVSGGNDFIVKQYRYPNS